MATLRTTAWNRTCGSVGRWLYIYSWNSFTCSSGLALLLHHWLHLHGSLVEIFSSHFFHVPKAVMTRRYNKLFPNDGRFSMCFSGPLSIPKVALRFLIGFCVWNLRGKKVFLDISGRSNTKKPTESIMLGYPFVLGESAADFASKVWLSVPLSAKKGPWLMKNPLNHVVM